MFSWKQHWIAHGTLVTLCKRKPQDVIVSVEDPLRVVVTHRPTGTTVDWDPSIGSLLDFAEENGVDIDFGCRAGNCGSCITAIKSGDVEYLSEPGEQPESGSCLACISVPKGPITLDA